MKLEHKIAGGTAALLATLSACALMSVPHQPDAEPVQILELKALAVPQQPAAQRAGIKRAASSRTAELRLIVPVEGVRRSNLKDTWGAPRDGGRTHKGIDIMADKGTAVRAAASGKIVKLFESAKGGTTVYQTDESGRYIFYYAHLDHYAEGLAVGQRVKQGDTIAYVGETGNAPVPHLHFEIQTQSAGRKWWRGVAFNPYPVLKAGFVEVSQHPAFARMK